ncbi:hypothetical protein [Acidaminobacter hydrogenoformans]|uniref:hypothetical protein n=1 Tax=Acidaminobacter hydrogenoformans TaxID=65403 RepID=UPI000B83ECE8|nr:hypothetical protein [Acidaminobacter hydrogenoformans]
MKSIDDGRFLKALSRRLCFMTFGICAFTNPLEPLSVYNMAFGAVFGLFFGWLFKRFLYIFLAALNSNIKKEWGKKVMRYPVETGMLFMIPFAVMLALATFVLKWNNASAFISTGMMAAGTSTAIEISRIRGKSMIRNAIATSGVSFMFSFLWTYAQPILFRAPGLIEGGVTFVRSLILGGGGLS